MTLLKQCKDAGYKSLAEFCEIIGVSPQTVSNWSKNKDKSKLLEAALKGGKK